MRTPPSAAIAAAQAAERKYGIFASVQLAQWALESAWGDKVTGRFNYFGIKALHDQPGVMCETHEVFAGVDCITHARFRDFTSEIDAFDAHAALLATGAPYKLAMQHKSDLVMFVRLMAVHYATDPEYAAKLMAIIKGNDLTRYDVKAA